MRKNQKIITTVLWSFLVLTMLAVVGRGMFAAAPKPPPVLFDAPHFTLTDQNAQPFDSAQLKGKVWVAAFIFTNCPGACPMMTEKMAKLQRAVPAKNVKLVSFSVDPQRDTPEALKQYAARFNADEARWHFLTGEKDAMFRTAAEMKLTALPAEGEREIQHSEMFLLVDGQGRVRGAYDSKDEEELKQLTRDADLLAGS